MKNIYEDAPANSTGPAISGTTGKADEVIVKGAARNRYKSGAKKTYKDFITMIRRRGPQK